MSGYTSNPVADSFGSTSSSLIAAAQHSEAEAWRRLSDLYGPLVYHWGRAEGLQPSDAADVVQDVFRSLATNLERFRKVAPGDSFRGWLWTITKNKVRDLRRASRRQPRALGGTDAQEQWQNVPDSPLAADDASTAPPPDPQLTAALEAIRSEFSDTSWRAFWRTAIDGQTSREVADELGLTPNAVRLAKARVLRRLRKSLGGPAN